MRSRNAVIAVAVLLAAGPLLAETTRTLRAELPAGATEAFVVENLAGHMTVTAGDDDRVVAVATVHAEDDALASTMRFEQVRGENGTRTLRVIYPVGEYRTFRYASSGSSEVRYDGRRVRVTSWRGVLLFADVEVKVPRRVVEATFRNFVGNLSAERVEGKILLDAASGDVEASELSGRVKLDTGSGSARAEGGKGSLSCDTGSGDVVVTRFDGDDVLCDTGSGGVEVRGVRASRLKADTGSGPVTVVDADIEEFGGDTGSGDIRLTITGGRLRQVDVNVGSGDVTLRLPADTGFELLADQGSGDLDCGFSDAQAVVEDREVVGYRRGDRRVRITADTGSGSVSISPR
ncbi:MAG TPA: DUF4097 family beta strand repeat-containing protein [Thermoanaerobaculaceae bacterium]|nr:DUF4097 family beta strand repeat-containing protein [Thermoanaerobaculaceae bacterium]HPS79167.1 DUF4097 family beta strand repeat-containing protein [Thermoanaerobaculaceae bacterium]